MNVSTAAAPIRIGAIFPQTEIGADPAGLRLYAHGVEELDFDHLLIYDHLVGADPVGHPGYTGQTAEEMFHEPFVLYGYLAGVAPKLELLTGIVVAPQRQTVLLAKQAAEVDVLTGGRFRLGLGIGWNPIEYEALGMSFTDRARRFEEQIELMRRLWQEPVISFEGRWHRVTAAGINPLPVQRPIPIWIGASAEPALRRAARLGDGWLPLQPIDRDWEATVEKVRSWVREAGRDPVTFGIEAQINVASGTPDDWAARVEMWRKLRATHLALFTMGANLAGPEAHLDRLREAREVLLELL